MRFSSSLRSGLHILRLAFPPMVLVGVAVTIGLIFHVRGKQVIESLLRERMESTVALGALSIDPQLVQDVQMPEDMDSLSYARLVESLKHIRSLAPHTRFAYIMRRTEDKHTLAFVADADALSTLEQLDVNNNGVVDEDEEAADTGDTYDISELSSLQDRAFLEPVVDDEFTVDQWGTVLSSFAPIFDDKGHAIAILGIDIVADEFYDMTQRTFSMLAVVLVSLVGAFIAVYTVVIMRSRHMESLRQLDSERSALLDLAMHQLGMPLATFRWWLEILKERDNGTFCKRGDVCDQLQEGIDRMDMIIKALRDAGDLQGNINHYKASKTSVATVVRKVAEDVQRVTATRGQKIVLDIAKNLPSVSIDRKLFGGMIREAMENASSYSPEKSHITLRARKVRGGVEIAVEDSGCGIPPQDMPHIFEKFRRGSNASQYKPAGNGLGLYIVKRITEKARGRIRISSELGKGTTLTIFLPSAT